MSYNESELSLNLSAEEQDLLNCALIHLIDAAEEMHNWDVYPEVKNPRLELLKQLHSKSIELWKTRWDS